MIKRHFYLYILCTIMLLSACEDGDPGPAGPDGNDGTAGENGTDGQNGVGYSELTKYGSIMIYLEGTRPDDIAFRDTSEFKYVPIARLRNYNTITIGESTNSISAYRFLSSPDDVYQASRVSLSATITEDGGDFSFNSFSLFYFKDITTEDAKVFEVSNTFDNSSYTDLVIEGYSYNETTGSLQFTFSFNVSGADNDTGNDLQVSGVVDIIVLQLL